jgi:hypothetical protein
MMNVLIIGNFDDLRGDSAIYLLERAKSGSCQVYFSGITGSISSSYIISHSQGNFTASINQLNWNDTPHNIIYSGSINSSPKFDAIIFQQYNYGDWQLNSIINSTLSASLKGIPVFTQHYTDSSSLFIKTSSSFYGFAPTINVGWGNYVSSNSGSYGNELEFYDTVVDGNVLTASVLLYGDSVGLLQTEDRLYIDNNDVNANELNAVASVTAKYINLVNVLSSSYSNSVNQIYSVYANANQYNNLATTFYYDIRQYLRKVSSNYNITASGWSSQQGYGMIQLQNYTGSNSSMPNLTSSIDFTNLGAGSPYLINVVSSSISGSYTFTWNNYIQSQYASTIIKINGRSVYNGTGQTYTWKPDITSNNAVVSFYTSLNNGLLSIPEANSIINLGSVVNLSSQFLNLNYGYSCANNGKYIAIGTVSIDPYESISGVVDVLTYSDVTNKYENSFLLKKLVNENEFVALLTTENATLDYTGSAAGNEFITTEPSSSYNITASFALGTQQYQTIEIQDGNFLYGNTQTVPYDNNPLDLELESVFPIVDSYSDKFGTSLALYGNFLAVGCPYFNITFTTGQNYSGGSVDIFDLTAYVQGQPYYPIASIYANQYDFSFGQSVTMYKNYLVIGSGNAYNNVGAVYIYVGSHNNTIWTLVQTIYGAGVGSYFGGTVKFDQSGNYNLIIGNANPNTGNVYVYSLINGGWRLTSTLYSNTGLPQTLQYLDNITPLIISNTADNFGHSVSIYGGNLIIGAPTDTIYQEYSGGPNKYRGAVYFYQTCSANPYQWQLIQKTWGNADTLVDNLFGYDVDIYGNTAIASVPKYFNNFTSNYITNTLNKRFDCNPNDPYFDVMGQITLFNYNTGSSQWDLTFIQQKKKDYGYPYLYYGYSSALYEETFAVGAPCFINDYRNLSNPFNNVIQGYGYVYNINDLITNYYVGNSFYRDGKLILSNSGSVFDKLMKDKFDSRYSKYNLSYESSVILYEKQILCTINPGEFNYSTNPTSMVNNSSFGFPQLDQIFKYINLQSYGNINWWNYLSFTDVELSLFNFYTNSYNIYSQSITPYVNQLSASYLNWDVDGNNKINLNDMELIWKYFAQTLTQNDVFTYVEPKSTRKTLTDINNYIQNNVVVQQYGQINPQFFGYNYSSSIDATGSYLAPYITTVGLYNGADLVAVAKLANPVKNGNEFPLNILIKWDI